MLLGVHYMKGGVTRGLLTKDVRSADGWQIGMDLFEHVQVSTRRPCPQHQELIGGIWSYYRMCVVALFCETTLCYLKDIVCDLGTCISL